MAGCFSAGYGAFSLSGKLLKAQRYAFQEFFGEIPDGLGALHHCDNPPCCNPTHLFAGTDADNMADKMAKGRHRYPVGEEASWAKLSAADVIDIRRRLTALETQQSIADLFGVARDTIGRIKRGQNWKHLEIAA